jgi:hypothetical protein
MRRPSFLLILLPLVLALGGQPALAAPGPATSAAAKPPPDLATMVLVPADLNGRPDAAIGSGFRYALDFYSGGKAVAIKAAGYVGGYETLLAAPVANKELTWKVVAVLDEFRTAKGGAAGFDALTPPSDLPNVGTKTIGAESKLSVYDGTDPYDGSKPDHGYTLVFRVGQIVATIYVDDFSGKSPKVAEAEALGVILATRIKDGLAGGNPGPGFGNRALRLHVRAGSALQDNYYRLDGKDLFGTLYDDLPKGTPSFDASYLHATDVYFTGQNDTGEADSPTYYGRVARFSSNYWAAKYVKTYLTLSATGSDGWQHVKEIKDARDFGDQSHTATFSMPAGQGAPGPTIYGTVIVARNRATTVTVRVEAFKPVPVSLVEGLMTAQMKCLSTTTACAAVSVPTGFQKLHLTSRQQPAKELAWDGIDRSARSA